MKYCFEFKLECVNFYQEKGTYPPNPKGVRSDNFKSNISTWSRLVLEHGTDSLKYTNSKRKWKPEEKLELIAKVKAGNSILSTAISAGINVGQLYKKYNKLRYCGLYNQLKINNPKISLGTDLKQ